MLEHVVQRKLQKKSLKKLLLRFQTFSKLLKKTIYLYTLIIIIQHKKTTLSYPVRKGRKQSLLNLTRPNMSHIIHIYTTNLYSILVFLLFPGHISDSAP